MLSSRYVSNRDRYACYEQRYIDWALHLDNNHPSPRGPIIMYTGKIDYEFRWCDVCRMHLGCVS